MRNAKTLVKLGGPKFSLFAHAMMLVLSRGDSLIYLCIYKAFIQLYQVFSCSLG